MCQDRCKGGSSANKVVLPDDACPEKYTIHLTPNFDSYTFSGVQTIDYTVARETDMIQLHARDMQISPYVTFTSETQSMHACEVSVNIIETVATIKFAKKLLVGKGSLKLEFTGTLNDQMAGFYRSGYTDAEGHKRHMATTQLEAIDARRMFPCVDEPAVKAVFELRITAPAELTVLSNMPESRKVYKKLHLDGGRSVLVQDVQFMPSPKMSSYLVACCIGQFEFVQSVTKRGTMVRVLCTPGKAKECEFALSVGVRSLEFYEDFFDLAYPLPKMDMIAVPDFAMGAMENWGLITYREIDLLCDAATVSVVRKTRLASVIAHEIAHQWFGNLVTMDWWDDLWLNEGFATFMQSYCCDALFPTWGVWDQYVCDDLDRARGLDGLRSSHPIQVPIPRAEDVEQVFDAISYCKGAAVVRLVFNVLGADVFRQGLRTYMKRHAYGNTVTGDLWKALQEAAGDSKVNVAELMGSWTEQMGYPYLSVSESNNTSGSDSPSKSKKSKTFQVQQDWFVADGSVQPDDANKLWNVPVFANSADLNTIIKTKTATVEVSSNKSCVKFNFGESAPIRVAYESPEIIHALLEAVHDKSLPAADRIGLLSDMRAFARSGKRDIDALLKMLKSYSKEDNVDVWSAIESTIGAVDRVVSSGLNRKKEFSEFVIKLAKSRFNELGWDNKPEDSDGEKRSRSILLRLVGSYCTESDSDVLDEARRRFAAYKTDQSTPLLSDDTRTAVLRIVLSNPVQPQEEEENWQFLKSVAESPKTSQTAKLNVYSAIGFVKSEKLKRATLDWCLTDNLKTQDFFYPMMGVRGSGDEGSELAWNFICDKFEAIKQRLAKASPSLLASCVQACASGSITESRADEIHKKFSVIPSLTRTVANLVESTKASAAFVARSKNTQAATTAEFWTELSTSNKGNSSPKKSPRH